jgi:hypothetical protein
MTDLFYSTAASLLTTVGFGVTALNILALTVALVVLSGLSILLYLLPAIVADERKHQHRVPILLLNLFLGWTLLGWVGALVWATMPVSPPKLPVGLIEEAAAVARQAA